MNKFLFGAIVGIIVSNIVDLIEDYRTHKELKEAKNVRKND